MDCKVKNNTLLLLLRTNDNHRVCHIPNICTWYNQQYHKLSTLWPKAIHSHFYFLLVSIAFFTFFISLGTKRNRIESHTAIAIILTMNDKKTQACREKTHSRFIGEKNKKKNFKLRVVHRLHCRQYRCHFYFVWNSEFWVFEANLTEVGDKRKCKESGSWSYSNACVIGAKI